MIEIEKQIKITTEFIRLDSLMKLAGMIGTGGQAKMVIADELVKVNGEICTMRGKKLRNGDIVEFENERVCVVEEE